MQSHIELPKRDQVIARDLAKPAGAALVAGIIGLAATAALGLGNGDGMVRFGHSLLVAVMFFLSIGLGALFFVILQHVTSAGWSVAVRRVAETLTGVLPYMAILVIGLVGIPAAMGLDFIYDWANSHSSYVEGSELIQHKAGYLNGPFFLGRIVLYFLIWIGVARFFAGQSRAQDEDQDPARTLKMQRRSGVAIILFGLATTFAAFDMMMSLNAEWFSTMYGVYFFAGAFWSSLATLALATMWLEKRGQLQGVVTKEHYHDIGKLMFAFTFFWSYVAFSQYMLYWYADISEETMWFKYRTEAPTADMGIAGNGWMNFGILLLVGHFLIPMLGLLSRHVKRRRNVLAAWCVYVLVFHFVDLYWNIMPEAINGAHATGDLGLASPYQGPDFGLIDITAMAGVAGIFVFGFLKSLDGKSALAIGDPRLEESMAFQNV